MIQICKLHQFSHLNRKKTTKQACTNKNVSILAVIAGVKCQLETSSLPSEILIELLMVTDQPESELQGIYTTIQNPRLIDSDWLFGWIHIYHMVIALKFFLYSF